MATSEVSEKDLEKVQAENEKLRDQIAEEIAALAEAQAQQAVQSTKDQLDDENARLKAQLADLKQQTKNQNAGSGSGQPVRYEDVVTVDVASDAQVAKALEAAEPVDPSDTKGN